MGRLYRIFRVNQFAARAEARRRAAAEYDVEPEEINVLSAHPFEDDDTYGWLVSVSLG
jgi:hypothetical protein